jgi:hypothetical protein
VEWEIIQNAKGIQRESYGNKMVKNEMEHEPKCKGNTKEKFMKNKNNKDRK